MLASWARLTSNVRRRKALSSAWTCAWDVTIPFAEQQDNQVRRKKLLLDDLPALRPVRRPRLGVNWFEVESLNLMVTACRSFARSFMVLLTNTRSLVAMSKDARVQHWHGPVG